MYVGIPRVHRFVYVASAVLIGAGLVVLGVAAASDEGLTGTNGILALALLAAGLFAVWAGLRVRGAVETMQESLSHGMAAFSGSGADVHPDGGGDAPDFDLSGLMETLAQAGINLDPKLFEHAQVVHDVQTINVSSSSVEDDALRRDGLRGTATVESLRPFMQFGEQTVAAVALQVALDGEPAPYPVTVNGLVPQAVASRLTPGMRVPVYVAADDHQRVLVDWDRA